MADRVSGGQLHTMGDVRRRLEDQEPFITIRASDPQAVYITRAIAGVHQVRVGGETQKEFLEMATRMEAWLDSHQQCRLIHTSVLMAGPASVSNPLGQCCVMVKVGVGPPGGPGPYRTEYRITSKFDAPISAIAALYGSKTDPCPTAQTFDEEHGWNLCDSRGDPIKRCGD